MITAISYLENRLDDLRETLPQVEQAVSECEREHAHHALLALKERLRELEEMICDFQGAIILLKEDKEKQQRMKQMKAVIDSQKGIFNRKIEERYKTDPKHLFRG